MANESFSYFGSILSYLIVAMPIFAGAFAGKDPSEMSEIISKVIFMTLSVSNKHSYLDHVELFLLHVFDLQVHQHH